MGFFSSLVGGKTKSTSSNAASGSAQSIGRDLMNIVNKTDYTSAFRPSDLNSAEMNAINNINTGFTPTAQSLSSDIAMQQNPFNQYVIDEINRQSQGQNSILQSNLNQAGQFGSNRGLLGANDIDLSRQNQIGGFLQGQYNTALNNALTTLPQSRAADASAQLGVGDYQRQLGLQQGQSQITALQALANILPALSGGGGTTTTADASKGLQNIQQLARTTGSLFSGIGQSDERLKENIRPLGKENGHNIYEFTYKEDPSHTRYIGVMAQEVEKTHPEAVLELHGMKAVDYNAIGVKFREAV